MDNQAKSQQNQIKTALIAIAVYIILQFVFFNTESVNVLASGIYLGLAKGVDRKTGLIFFITITLFSVLDDILLKNGLSDPQRGSVAALLSSIIAGVIGAAIPLGIMWIIRKISKA